MTVRINVLFQINARDVTEFSVHSPPLASLALRQPSVTHLTPPSLGCFPDDLRGALPASSMGAAGKICI